MASRKISDDLPAAIRAISALAELFNTHSTRDEELAIDAFQAGRPAYWSTASYSNQIASILHETANRHGLESALKRCATDENDQARSTPYLLSTLIPLNSEARVEIMAAWYALDREQARRARAARPVPMFDDSHKIAAE